MDSLSSKNVQTAAVALGLLIVSVVVYTLYKVVSAVGGAAKAAGETVGDSIGDAAAALLVGKPTPLSGYVQLPSGTILTLSELQSTGAALKNNSDGSTTFAYNGTTYRITRRLPNNVYETVPIGSDLSDWYRPPQAGPTFNVAFAFPPTAGAAARGGVVLSSRVDPTGRFTYDGKDGLPANKPDVGKKYRLKREVSISTKTNFLRAVAS